MDFSLTTAFILPVSNTLPTTGTNANLVANQFGVFAPNYTPATAANVAANPYILLSQGRQQTLPGVGTKNSDHIYLKNVIDWYKVTASANGSNQITDIGSFSAQCGETVTISIRLRSFYLDTAYFNGLTKSYTALTPCCDCGDDPCTDVDQQALVDSFVTLINADQTINGAGRYITAARIGTGSTSILRLFGKILTQEPRTADPTNFPFQYDRVYFWAFAYKGPATSQDYNVWDSCDPFATVSIQQRATYPRGSSIETLQIERNYWSYNQPPIAKRLFSDINFNGGYTTQVVDGTFYDFYYLKFKSPKHNEWNPVITQDESVIICNPTGQNASTIAVLTAFLGTPVDESGPLVTTTTTTSTSSSSTTSTTTTNNIP